MKSITITVTENHDGYEVEIDVESTASTSRHSTMAQVKKEIDFFFEELAMPHPAQTRLPLGDERV